MVSGKGVDPKGFGGATGPAAPARSAPTAFSGSNVLALSSASANAGLALKPA